MNPKFLKAVLLQFTGTVGAGIFSLPYVLHHSNFYLSSLFLVFFAFLVIVVNRYYLEVITATKGDHQLPGYAHIYLGPKFKNLAVLNIFLLAIGALSAYLKLSSGFITSFFPHLSPQSASLIFFLVLAFFFFFKSRILETIHFSLPLIVIFISLLFYFLAISYHLPTPQLSPFSLAFIGPVLFSLSSFTIVPEVEEVLRSSKDHHYIKSASMLGTLSAVILYLIFSTALIFLSGQFLSTDSVTGLRHISPLLAAILSFIGLITIFTASLNFLTVIKEVFFRDLCINKSLSHLLAMFIPLICLFFSKVSFIELISLTGSITVFISVLIICLIRLHLPLHIKDKLLLHLIIFIFFLGLLAQFFFLVL